MADGVVDMADLSSELQIVVTKVVAAFFGRTR
jgi:hypothetical protein